MICHLSYNFCRWVFLPVTKSFALADFVRFQNSGMSRETLGFTYTTDWLAPSLVHPFAWTRRCSRHLESWSKRLTAIFTQPTDTAVSQANIITIPAKGKIRHSRSTLADSQYIFLRHLQRLGRAPIEAVQRALALFVTTSMTLKQIKISTCAFLKRYTLT